MWFYVFCFCFPELVFYPKWPMRLSGARRDFRNRRLRGVCAAAMRGALVNGDALIVSVCMCAFSVSVSVSVVWV